MQPPGTSGFDTSHSRIFRDLALIGAAVIIVVYGFLTGRPEFLDLSLVYALYCSLCSGG